MINPQNIRGWRRTILRAINKGTGRLRNHSADDLHAMLKICNFLLKRQYTRAAKLFENEDMFMRESIPKPIYIGIQDHLSEMYP